MRLTLNETWVQCLKMWKWIAKIHEDGDSVCDLKGHWLFAHGFNRVVYHYCFFCDWSRHHGARSCTGLMSSDHCNCPAGKIDPEFICNSRGYNYDRKPDEFYHKLVELNKIRLTKKRKTK